MNEITKPNDILVATLSAPNSSVLDLLQNNITADNTSLLSKEDYKNTPLVKKAFSDENGNFDETAFNNLYSLAELKYAALDDDKLFNSLSTYLEYGETSRYRPIDAEKRKNTYEPEKFLANSLHESVGLVGINKKSTPTITEEEAAQSGGIWDPINKKWLGTSAEDQNIFLKLFGQTLVYATYDKDGVQENPVTGEVGLHRKGEFIKDADGQYFTELLGDRDLLDKKVVVTGDILTREGSILNKLDFFDSDGYEKSIGGVAMKSLVTVLPYLIPGVNTYYGAFTALVGLSSVLPTFYKSLESIITGDTTTGSYKAATTAENWFRKFESSTSRKGQLSFFSIESIGNLLSDVFGQLYQLRAAASLSKLLYKLPEGANAAQKAENVLKMNKAAKTLSLGYMGLISVSDVYNDALNSGYDKRTAGIASLMSAAALFGIMNYNEGLNGLGTWFLDKTTGYDHEITRAPIARIAKSLFKDIEADVLKAIQTGDKKALGTSLSKFKRAVRDYMDDTFRIGGEDLWKNAIVEGVEEVSEEIVQDSVKGVIDTLSWLGFTGKEGSFGGWSNVFSKEGAQRYLQTFFGGAAGGALFSAQMKYIDPAMRRLLIDPNYKSEWDLMAEKDILDVILSGRTNELIDELKRCKTLLRDKSLPTGLVGQDGSIIAQLNDENLLTLADMIVAAAIDQVLALDSWVKQELKGEDFDFNLYTPKIQKLIKDRWKGVIEDKLKISSTTPNTNIGGDAAIGYISKKFVLTLSDLRKAYGAYYASSNKKEGSTENDIKKADKQGSEVQLPSSVDYKKDYEAKLAEVRSFFSGKGFTETYREASILHSPYLMSVIGLMDERTFYETFIKSDTFTADYDSLLQSSKNPYEMTKDKVRSEWLMFRNENASIESLLDKLPRMAAVMDKIMSNISGDIASFASNEHKKAIIKAMESYVLSSTTIDDYVDNLKQSDLFSPEELESMSDEEKETESAKRRLQVLEQLKHSKAATNFVRLILANPNAWTLHQRFKIDYASKLLDNGAIKIKGYSDELIKIIKELINQQFIASRANIFTPGIMKLLLANVNTALADQSNLYTLKIQELYKQDKGIGPTMGSVQYDSTKDLPEITELKLNSMEEYISGDEFLEEGLFNSILNLKKALLLDKLSELSKLKIEQYDQQSYVSKYLTNLITLLNNNSFDLKELEGIARNLGSEIFMSTQGLNVEEQLNLYKSILRIFNVSETDKNLLKNPAGILTDTLVSEVKKITDFVAKLNESKVIENPIVSALNKIYFLLTDGLNSSIIKWAIDKAQSIINNNADVNRVEFTPDELKGIDSAINTIEIVKQVVAQMVAYDSSQPYYGTNQIMVDYIKAYKDGDEALLDKYQLIDEKDYILISKILDEAKLQLSDLKQIKSELVDDKTRQYEDLRRLALKNEYSFFKVRPKLYIDKQEYNLVPEDFDFTETEDLGELQRQVLKLKQNAALVIQSLKENDTLKSRVTPDHDINLVLIDIFWDSFISDDDVQNKKALYRSGRLSSEAVSADENTRDVDGQWYLGMLTGMLNISPKQVYKEVSSILENHKSVYPRLDLMEAMIKIITVLESKEEFNYLNSKFVQAYNLNPDAFNKELIENTMFLFGSGGSGKTLISTLLGSKYKEKFGDNVYTVAKSLKKVTELSEAFKKEQIAHQGKKFDDLVSGLSTYLTAYKKAETEFLTTLVSFNLNDSNTWKSEKDSQIKVKVSEDKKTATLTYDVKDQDNKVLFTLSYIYDSSKGKTELAADLGHINIDIKADLKPAIEDNSFIVIDECTLLNQFDFAVLKKLAKEHNITVLGIGDPKLQGDTISYRQNGQTTVKSIGMAYIFGTYLPELLGSWRSDNNAALGNAEEVKAILVKDNAAGLDIDEISNAWSTNDTENLKNRANLITFKYTVNGNPDKFMGTQITNSIDKAKSTVALIPQGASVAVIVNSDADKDIAKAELESLGLIGNIEYVTLLDILGAEYDYTVSYRLLGTSSLIDNLTKVYTEITRARKGNLVILNALNDLFNVANLNKSAQANVYKMGDINLTENNIQFVLALNAAINTTPDISIKKNTTSMPPDKPAGVTPTPSPVFNDDNFDDAEKDNLKKILVSERLKNAGFTDFAINQGYYFRVGENKEVVDKLRNGDKNTVIALVEKAKVILNNPDSELAAFLRLAWFNDGKILIKGTRKEALSHFSETISEVQKRLGNSFDESLITESIIKSIIPTFEYFIRRMKSLSLITDSYGFKYLRYNDDIDFILDKLNNTPTDRDYITRFGIPITVTLSDGNAINCLFTTGSIGYTLYDEEGQLKSTSDFYSNYIKNPSNLGQLHILLVNPKAKNEAALKYNQGKKNLIVNENSAVSEITTLRTIKSDIGFGLDPKLRQPSTMKDSPHLRFGRTSLAEAELRGLKLGKKLYTKKALLGDDTNKAKFIDEYNNYRVEKIDSDSLRNSYELEWYLVHYEGSDKQYPILLHLVTETLSKKLFVDPGSPQHEKHNWWQNESHNSNGYVLNYYGHYLIILGLIQSVKNETVRRELRESLLKLYLADNNSIKYDEKNSYAPDTSAYNNFIGLLTTNLSENLKAAVEKAHFIDAWLGSEIIRNRPAMNKWTLPIKEASGKRIQNGDKDFIQLVETLDKEVGKYFFYDNLGSKDITLVDHNLIVIEQPLEDLNFVINFSILTDVTVLPIQLTVTEVNLYDLIDNDYEYLNSLIRSRADHQTTNDAIKDSLLTLCDDILSDTKGILSQTADIRANQFYDLSEFILEHKEEFGNTLDEVSTKVSEILEELQDFGITEIYNLSGQSINIDTLIQKNC